MHAGLGMWDALFAMTWVSKSRVRPSPQLALCQAAGNRVIAVLNGLRVNGGGISLNPMDG